MGATEVWMNGLSSQEKNDIDEYTTAAYVKINKALRQGDENDRYYQQGMRIDDAIQRFDLKENIVVHRGDNGGLLDVRGVSDENMEATLQSLVGRSFKSKNLISTDVALVPEIFSSSRLEYEIKVPAGKGRGAYVRPLSPLGEDEREFLMSTKNKYRMTGYKKRKNDYLVYLQVS